MGRPSIDECFLAMPRQQLAVAALHRARELGVEHADVRVERIRHQQVAVRDDAVQGISDSEDLGYAVRVIYQGAWGFASDVVLTPQAARRTAERAVEMARLSAPMTTTPVRLAPEPVHRDVAWISDYRTDPWEVPTEEKADLLLDWTNRLRSHPCVDHASAALLQVKENKYYADLTGTTTTQQRVRLMPHFEAFGSDAARGLSDSMTTLAPPVGKGWEYLTDGSWDWDAELAEVPDLLAAKLAAPGVVPGHYDLVIHPSNLWLTIHESVGHATELDRALGHEASYAGTSFATPDQLDTLEYGSPAMQVTADRTVPHGLATVGYDDDGVTTGAWDLVRDGILVGFQDDRSTASLVHRGDQGTRPRSTGCAYADSPGHIPLQRMANVSLRPASEGPSTEELLARVEDGIYVVGDRSWSIDMQRFNFQFTGQRFYRIRDGRLAGQVRDVAYQATTTDFWRSMEAVGGPQTYVLGGAFNCGKAQPGQVAPVSHGCPTALFRQVRVLNTTEEGATS